ncbi:MAG: hypothetical protein QXV17_14940 [Candidatus Micrarchaeaceae archaeon]
MRFFVYCKYHSGEKIYIQFTTVPQVRSQIPPFNATCPQGYTAPYNKDDVIAEAGPAVVGGAVVGALLFLLDPVLGILGAILGGLGVGAAEQAAVERFNKSR